MAGSERIHPQGFLASGFLAGYPPGEQSHLAEPPARPDGETPRHDLSFPHYGRPFGLRCGVPFGRGESPGSSSGSTQSAAGLPLKAERSTSLAKKFLPSIGTIMICNLSESRSAMIF